MKILLSKVELNELLVLTRQPAWNHHTIFVAPNLQSNLKDYFHTEWIWGLKVGSGFCLRQNSVFLLGGMWVTVQKSSHLWASAVCDYLSSSFIIWESFLWGEDFSWQGCIYSAVKRSQKIPFWNLYFEYITFHVIEIWFFKNVTVRPLGPVKMFSVHNSSTIISEAPYSSTPGILEIKMWPMLLCRQDG
jgi:hypothetical protein